MNTTDNSSTCDPELSFTGYHATSARILVGISALFCFLGIVGNVMAGMAVFSTRRLNLSYHYFLSSLTVAELILALVCQPLLIALILAQLDSRCIPALQLTFRLIGNVASFASMATVTLIGLDTYLYTCGKFNYTNTITSRKKMALVFVWIMAGVIGGMALVPYTKYVTFTWTVISFFSYATVYYQFSLQQNNRSKSSHAYEIPADQRNTVQSGNETLRWQVACRIITILLLFSVRFLPMFLFNILNLGKRFDLLFYTIVTMGLLPTALFPVVYCLCYHNYRRALKRLWSRFIPFTMKHHREIQETLKGHVGQEFQSSIESTAV